MGGGISGLAAAFWLTRLLPRASITLFEKQDRLGGLIGTQSVRGRLLETGPLAFPSAAPATAEFLEASGLAGLCAPAGQKGGVGLWNGKRIIPFARTAPGILKSGLLTPLTLLRLAAEPFIPRGKDRDESVAGFFRRRTGNGFMQAVMEPMSSGILAGDPDKMSMAANYPMLFRMERKWGSLARGMWEKRRASKGSASVPPAMAAGLRGNQSLVDAIGDDLSRQGVALRLSAGLTGLRASDAGKLELDSAGRAPPETFDSVIACIPPGELARLCRAAGVRTGPEEGLLRFLEGIPYASLALGYLSYRKEDLSGVFGGEGCLIQGKTRMGILSLFLPSRMFGNRCPPREELVRVMAGGAKSTSLAELPEEEFRLLSANAISDILHPMGSPLDFTLIRQKEALPQLVKGHAEGLAQARGILATLYPGLIPAGTGYSGAGIENAIREGKRAAYEVRERWKGHG